MGIHVNITTEKPYPAMLWLKWFLWQNLILFIPVDMSPRA